MCVTGPAAYRLRSREHGLVAGAHFVLLLAAFALTGIYGPESWQNSVAAFMWALGPWWGGSVHAFVLRARLARPPMAAPPISNPPISVPATPVPPGSGPWNPWGTPAPPAPPVSPAPPRVRMYGTYTVLSTLGEGGQGVVYLGAGPDGRQVAIKVLHERLQGTKGHLRFTREVTAAKRVPPFSTARILDVGFEDEAPYIVSEYVRGPSLDRLVRANGPLNGDSLVRLAIATSAALNAIHSVEIVHRDLKPANVLIGPDGPRVIDFGIAKALDQATMTSGVVKGTPAYMSPEQVSGLPISPQTDVFSWASTMYYGATGRQAFDGRTVFQVFEAVLHHQPDLRELPSPLRGPLAACLDKEPRNRPTPAELMLSMAR
ncbi:serine/threonine protein kinase [Herbidospora galbida]|uniref:Serine/threonine protein kinase n=1 Tax=Herbidospora galbida TaxID=2575442 RepID=A0A4U3MEJ8_9ACTN|nr:serine/threonine-protein kinase [Herbidospora galbida]TKK87531.1 serine/threonine protein kinase [Herbidospora galbida]